MPGLSPRVRGNLPPRVVPMKCHRSIPARAGEPLPWVSARQLCGVYPRACGGTHSRHSPIISGWRSIPARAGEPSGSSPSLRLEPVYPRACGGNHSCRQVDLRPIVATGLSPRVRGNLSARRLHFGAVPLIWSIPARAGEPRGRSAFGGCANPSGLSRRVRGNPACDRYPAVGVIKGVYPRACGGTIVTSCQSP